jgi:hypothetical protein
MQKKSRKHVYISKFGFTIVFTIQFGDEKCTPLFHIIIPQALPLPTLITFKVVMVVP